MQQLLIMKQALFLLCLLTTGLSAQTTVDDHIRARSSFRIGSASSFAATGVVNAMPGSPSTQLITSKGVYDWFTGTLTFSGDVSGLYNNLTLANSGVTAGTCTNCSLTIDAKGRVTVKGSGSAGATYTAGAGIAISGGNEISATDASATNELQTLDLTANILEISGRNSVDLSGYLDNTDGQTLSYSAPNLTISGGNSVDISGNNYWSKTGSDVYYTAGNIGIGTALPASKLDITTNALGVTQANTSGLSLINTTAAAAGSQQISPGLLWEGQGWKTTATAASQSVRFRADALPVQGTTAPTGVWQLGASIAGGAYTNRLTMGSDGAFFLGVVSGNNITSNASVGMQISGGANGAFRIRSINGGYTTFFTVQQNYDYNSQPGTWVFKNESPSLGNNSPTGTGAHVVMSENFKPASGTAVFSELALTPIINQTGGANGITRGLYINPTLTAAADFRAIEVEVSGSSVFSVAPTGAVQSLYDRYGSGSPEGAVSAPVGAVYHRTDGGTGTAVYHKETGGTGNTGWVPK